MSKQNTIDQDELRTLGTKAAAKFFDVHPVTLQRMAKNGQIPAAKFGRKWIFYEIDLIASMRAQYSTRVTQDEPKEKTSCPSTKEKIAPCYGSSSTTAEKSYREALGLPTR